MTKEKEIINPRLKTYHIFLLSCLLCSVLIINSNYVNEQRSKKKLNTQNNKLFNDVISLRKLEPQSNSDTDEVCSRGSDDLIEYYKTGDLSLIDLDEDPIKCDDKDADYMKALRGLMRNLVGGGDDDERLRNLDEGESDTDNIKQYINRVIPMLFFLVIGVLSIFGWIGCCISACCDCCCCCCCKKKTCKIPWFIFTYVFYALVVAVCIYGLSESNKIFKGLANTECSLLKFFDQILDGEIKQDLPRWAGISGITGILSGLNREISDMGDTTYNTLEFLIDKTETNKSTFSTKMQTAGDVFFTSNQYKAAYLSKDFTNYPKADDTTLKGQYVLDMVRNFGRYENNKYTTASILDFWYTEYSNISSLADSFLNTSKSSFNDILVRNLEPIQNSLTEAEGTLGDIREPFDDVNGKIGGKVSDYADKVDKYGKLAVKIIFSVLMVMNIALAVLMALIGLFSMKPCVDCCFCRCLFKSCTHILWNVLALMMILAFIIGSILGLLGRIGDDIMSLASFIFSEDNFNAEDPLFLDEMGEGKNYLRRCILGDGDIAAELNISSQIGSMDALSSIEQGINETYIMFQELIDRCPVYTETVNNLKKRNDLTDDFKLFSSTDEAEPFNFDDVIESMNAKITASYPNPDSWNRNGNNVQCPNTLPNGGKMELNPLTCNPYDKYTGLDANDDIKKFAEVISESMRLGKYANDETKPKTSTSDSPSLICVLNDLKADYSEYLGSYKVVLEFVLSKIQGIMDIVRDYIQEGDSFSFLNGSFIKINLKILLKYLKYSLGKDFYTVGVCLIVVGLSLILSISSTILLTVIINIDLKENMAANNPVTPINEVNVINAYTPGGDVYIPEYQTNANAMQTGPIYS